MTEGETALLRGSSPHRSGGVPGQTSLDYLTISETVSKKAEVLSEWERVKEKPKKIFLILTVGTL
jgi:hypothetical protein